MKRLTTRELIANATLQLLQTKKIEDIGVNDILLQAGVSKRTFYNHFRDKFDVCNYIYDHLLDTYCWQVNGERQSLSEFFQNFQEITSAPNSPYTNFFVNTMYYEGQNCLQDYIAIRGVEDQKQILRWNGREDLITPENIYLLEFYMQGMIGMRVSWVTRLKRKPTELSFAYDLTRYLPKELYDVLTSKPTIEKES